LEAGNTDLGLGLGLGLGAGLGLGLWAWALALGVGLGLGLGLDFSKKGHMNRNQKKTSISKKRVLPISTLDYGLLILQLDSAAQLLF